MKFQPTSLAGAVLVELSPHPDERGFFTRTFCEQEFEDHGLPSRFPQANLSRNTRRGTLRGMHYNAAPHGEAKLVRCARGSIWDAIVDLRAGSPTRLRWLGVRLSAAQGNALFVPEGFAHGFVTLEEETDVEYLMGRSYVAEAARGFPWNDPRIGIGWPVQPEVIGAKDLSWPPFDEARFDG